MSHKIRVRVTLELDVDWPCDERTKEHIEFYYNDGTFCSQQIIPWLQRLAAKNPDGCICCARPSGGVKHIEVLVDLPIDHCTRNRQY